MTHRRLFSKRDALEILSHWITDTDVATRTLLLFDQEPEFAPPADETTLAGRARREHG